MQTDKSATCGLGDDCGHGEGCWKDTRPTPDICANCDCWKCTRGKCPPAKTYANHA